MASAIALTFHGIVDPAGGAGPLADQAGASRYAVSAELFAGILDTLKSRVVCAAGDLSGASGPDLLVLTFDDGLISDYEVVFPGLASRNLRATFFVNPDNIGKSGYCARSHLCEMSRCGMEIASHGRTHRYLVTMPRAEAAMEISQSKTDLENILGTAVCSFAAVGGHYRGWMVSHAAGAGYRAFATLIPGRTLITAEQIVRVRRNHIQAGHNMNYIDRIIRGDGRLLAMNRLRYLGLASARRILGMNTYDQIRTRLLRKLNPANPDST